ncbi:unnamed protein product [Vicia faba]|uniref:Uncharacterized protein n=1 Tax=Vicia faba TaxID=3906 RepID=A0AAV1B0P3_VICFA|nr:unnamed protein product [Vicia faba]
MLARRMAQLGLSLPRSYDDAGATIPSHTFSSSSASYHPDSQLALPATLGQLARSRLAFGSPDDASETSTFQLRLRVSPDHTNSDSRHHTQSKINFPSVAVSVYQKQEVGIAPISTPFPGKRNRCSSAAATSSDKLLQVFIFRCNSNTIRGKQISTLQPRFTT